MQPAAELEKANRKLANLLSQDFARALIHHFVLNSASPGGRERDLDPDPGSTILGL